MTLGPKSGCAASLLVLGLGTVSCSHLSPPRLEANGTLQQHSVSVSFDGGSLEIHLARRVPEVPDAPLVVFASGDGGWFGAAIGMFDAIAAAGYPVAGVSSRALLHDMRTSSHPLSAVRLLEAYGGIIAAAQQAFSLPANRDTVLAGWSRGASLSVIVGAAHPTTPVAGVVAIGLAAAENLNVDLTSDDEAEEPGVGVLHGIDTYAASLAIPGRVAVIQSSGDGYLAANRAHALFGADTAARHFYEVPASNHRFSGGETAFRRNLRDALRWISTGEDNHP